jgi:hypothetical protein
MINFLNIIKSDNEMYIIYDYKNQKYIKKQIDIIVFLVI